MSVNAVQRGMDPDQSCFFLTRLLGFMEDIVQFYDFGPQSENNTYVDHLFTDWYKTLRTIKQLYFGFKLWFASIMKNQSCVLLSQAD